MSDIPRHSESGIDYNAALARLEMAVALLGTCHVADGFRLDRKGAEDALDYLQRRARGEPDDSERFERFLNFMKAHGQSFDWVFTGDVGGMICQLAAIKTRGTAR